MGSSRIIYKSYFICLTLSIHFFNFFKQWRIKYQPVQNKMATGLFSVYVICPAIASSPKLPYENYIACNCLPDFLAGVCTT